MNPELNPHRMTRLLTDSTRQLDHATLVSLSQSREKALKKQAIKSPVWVWAGHAFPHHFVPHIQHPWLAAGLLIAALFMGADFWQSTQEQQNCEIDVAILTDELPLEVFLD